MLVTNISQNLHLRVILHYVPIPITVSEKWSKRLNHPRMHKEHSNQPINDFFQLLRLLSSHILV